MSDQLYINMLKSVAEMSYCNRRKVGAILVSPDKKNVYSYAFNGTIPGFPNVCELDNGETNNDIVLHAETNAIMKVAKLTLSTIGCHLFIGLSPCVDCAKLIIQSEISTVTFVEEYKCTKGIDLLKKSGITVKQWLSET